jgi:nucleotide-binding universal stress UspA family protein
MNTPEKVLCPVDFADCSRLALRHALALAKSREAELIILHAYWVPASIQPTLLVWAATGARPIVDVAEEQARRELDEFLKSFADESVLRARVVLVHDDPASTILEFASRERVSLIVLGTHGRTGVSRFFMGSVAERVVRGAPCPVLTLRKPEKPESAIAHPDLPASPVPMSKEIQVTKLDELLVPVDFSACSVVALDKAAELAKSLGATLDVLHVWQAPSFVATELMVGGAGSTQTLTEFVKAETETKFREFLKAARERGIAIRHERLVQGSPPAVIIDEAERGGHDLIALGTHGRTGLSHFLLGSVAEKVVRQASCPVLVIREAKAPAVPATEGVGLTQGPG